MIDYGWVLKGDDAWYRDGRRERKAGRTNSPDEKPRTNAQIHGGTQGMVLDHDLQKRTFVSSLLRARKSQQ